MAEFVEEDPPGAPEWIVTFSDMVSLLVTFFVLLLTFSSTATKEVPNSDTKSPFGLFESTASAVAARQIELMTRDQTDYHAGSVAPHARPPEDLLQSVVEMGRKPKDGELGFDVLSGSASWRIRFADGAAFARGSAVPNEQLAAALSSMAEALAHYDVEVVVEACADEPFTADETFADEPAQALARAAAAGELLAKAGLRPERLGCSTHTLRRSADGKVERILNRRFELRVLPRGKA